MDAHKTFPRQFVPKELDVSNLAGVEKLYRDLLDRPLGSLADIEQMLADFSELASVVDEYGTRRYIDKSCHTDDPKIVQAYLRYVEEIEPRIKPLHFALQRKFLDHPLSDSLQSDRYTMLRRRWHADVEVFRPENIELETQATRLVNEYDKLSAAMMVTFRGQQYTQQQMARFGDEPNRPTREAAWRASAERRLADREQIETIYDALLPLRQKIARQANLPDYRAYCWKSYKRSDYSPDDCLRFADAIAETCVPAVRELDAARAEDLGLAGLRPWDLAVDVKNRSPLRPFAENQIDLFVQKVTEIFRRMSPSLAEEFDSLRQMDHLDLGSRRGKQPGGYQSTLEEAREPFIFMNAAGLQRDIETLLHEGGHAFHALAAREEPLMFLRSAPMEFCEVASMGMEALATDHYDAVYDHPDEAARAKRACFEGIVRFFPWMATIDSFQHWIYTHPSHSRAERTAHWLALLDRFGSRVDFDGLESARESMWQRQLHLFHAPFYYVEYGIAQLGALQLWMKSREDPRRAMANYRASLKLGGTRPLPELFRAAGIQFDFSKRTLGPLIQAVGEELASLQT